MEQKQFSGGLKAVNGEGMGVARIAMLGPPPDRDGDILERGVLGGEQTVSLLVAHDWSRLPAGKATVREEDGAILARFRVNMDMAAGRALHSALTFDLSTPPSKMEWSFGYLVKDAQPDLHEGQRIRRLRRIELIEVSPVIKGAGRETMTLALKEGILDQAALVAMHERIQQRGAALAERLAKLEGLVSYRHVKMEGFTLLDPRRHLAREVSFHAAKELNIPVPALKFFTSTDPERADFTGEPMWGYADKGGIGVEWSLSPDEMVQVVAHECGHAAGLDEEKADAFGKQFAARYGMEFGTAPCPSGWTLDHCLALDRMVRSGVPLPL